MENISSVNYNWYISKCTDSNDIIQREGVYDRAVETWGDERKAD